MSTLKIGSIKPTRYNPRRHWDENEYQELRASVRQSGILQPILVRPLDDGYEVVAGSRRYKAALEEFGVDAEIPVLIKEMDDDEAAAAAMLENVIRANMSPAEEAEAAAKVLAFCDGNRDEAANRLGWTRSTLDRRLALMNASQAVRDALSERKITLGHAELLAGIAKAKQDGALQKLLAMEKLPSTDLLRKELQRYNKALSTAIFDKTQCATCEHNSDQQKALFSTSVDGGHCTHAQCYDDKTEQELNQRLYAMREEYPRIEILRPGDNFRVVPLKVEGPTGVGETQARACWGCANYGGAVSGLPQNLGEVHRDICFDTACNSKKVAARIKAEADEAAAEQQPKETVATQAADVQGSTDKAAVKVDKPKAKPTASAVSAALVAYREKVWRHAVYKAIQRQPEKGEILLLAMAAMGNMRDIDHTKVKTAVVQLLGASDQDASDMQGNLFSVAEHAGKIHEDKRLRLMRVMIATTTATTQISNITQMMQFLAVNLGEHWKICNEFLDLLTKSEIAALAEETGIMKAMGDKSKKVFAGKKAEIVKAILELENFQFEGVVPKVMLPPSKP